MTCPVRRTVYARQHRLSIATLYALNTAGAAAGTLLMAFVALPALGVTRTLIAVAAVNGAVFLSTWLLKGHEVETTRVLPPADPGRSAV